MITNSVTCNCWDGTPPIPPENQMVTGVVADTVTGLVSIRQACTDGSALGELLSICPHGARELAIQLNIYADIAERRDAPNERI